jgi:hypothetical protein
VGFSDRLLASCDLIRQGLSPGCET